MAMTRSHLPPLSVFPQAPPLFAGAPPSLSPFPVAVAAATAKLSLKAMRKPRRKAHQDVSGPQSSSPCCFSCSPTRETLTYAQAQRMVDVEIEGRLHRISIFEPLRIVSEDELTAQDITECNSNKENTELTLSTNCRKAFTKGKKREICPKHAVNANLEQLPQPVFRVVESVSLENTLETFILPDRLYHYIERPVEELEKDIEYDLDETDLAWLDIINEKRQNDGFSLVPADTFELLLDKLEKESYHQSRCIGVTHSPIDENAFCCVCLDDECHNSNAILFCDMCNLAVHQECYGVPYIPEGQWLCRCCLQSPSKPVSCVLCPNQGGAFKQTTDGRWAHVVCAIWVPEVCFANTVFLEPVEGVDNIPPARWKLTCYLCKQKGCGASIQCHKVNCYAAFHVTCAQRAGLFMKVEPLRETGLNGTTYTVRKTAYCEAHRPPGTEQKEPFKSYLEDVDDQGQIIKDKDEKYKKRKSGKKFHEKMFEENNIEPVRRRGPVPLMTVIQIPLCRLIKISSGICLQKKTQFLQNLHSYWLLKRQSRNGAPLIRRLHSHMQSQRGVGQKEKNTQSSSVKEAIKYWQKLRHDLERARLLTELIRKREKLKREQVKLDQAALELQLTPFNVFLRTTLDLLQAKDSANIFNEPVNLKEVPDYMNFILHPMDFSTMRHKLECHQYPSFLAFENDFNLMVSNCLRYNSRETVFHQAALRLHQLGTAILCNARHQAESIGYDSSTLMHLPEKLHADDYYRFSWEEVDELLRPENRAHLPPEYQLKELLEKLDIVSNMRSSGARTRRLKLLRREINILQQKLIRNKDFLEACPDGKSMHPPMLEPANPSQPIQNATAYEHPPSLQRIAHPAHDQANNFSPMQNLRRRTSVTLGRLLNETKTSVKTRQSLSGNESDEEKIDYHPPAEATNGVAGIRLDSVKSFECTGELTLYNSGLAPLGKPALSHIPLLETMNCDDNRESCRMSFESCTELKPLQLVWAKCRGYPSYPALIIDPNMPREGLLHNGIPIPVPPLDVLKLGEQRQLENAGQKLFLVLFFDNKRTWQWLSTDKVLPLGTDDTVDKLKMLEGRKTSIRKSVQVAYDRAMSHLSRVRGYHPFIASNYLY
ncbi:bromodomain and PHD finger-containing protein 3 isoform X2 [Hyla sarda]|uniref:bromodomain and PHD finger-containing protein 3 isoform X2 n=1 Tax=Hyla sarda TaxID=327740 RepID=UPI0024C34876|nr:bromodomain and PHD finger-containing protein 3 isoform X2 [Hyla sarda]